MVVVDESAAVAVAVRSESVGNAESEADVAEATSDESCLLSFFFKSTSISRKRYIQGEKVTYQERSIDSPGRCNSRTSKSRQQKSDHRKTCVHRCK